jgi:hypothetical protein
MMQTIKLAFQFLTMLFPIFSMIQTRYYGVGLWFNIDWTEETLLIEEQAAKPLRINQNQIGNHLLL